MKLKMSLMTQSKKKLKITILKTMLQENLRLELTMTPEHWLLKMVISIIMIYKEKICLQTLLFKLHIKSCYMYLKTIQVSLGMNHKRHLNNLKIMKKTKTSWIIMEKCFISSLALLKKNSSWKCTQTKFQNPMRILFST